MQTIFLSGASYQTAAQVHAALNMLLNLPDYYGGNADALHDCLSERREPVNLYLADWGRGEVEQALRKVCRVIEDLDGTVTVRDSDAVQL